MKVFDPKNPRWNQPKNDGRTNEERRRQLAPAIRGFVDGGLEVYQAEDGSLWYDPQVSKELYDRDLRERQSRSLREPLSESPLDKPRASNDASLISTSENVVNEARD